MLPLIKRSISLLLLLIHRVPQEKVQHFYQSVAFVDSTLSSSEVSFESVVDHIDFSAILYGEKASHPPLYSSLLPSSALDRVTSSAYSKSPPTGKPCAILVSLIPDGFNNLEIYIAVASPSILGFVAKITS